MNHIKVLIVEDELIIAENIKMCIESMGYEVLDTTTSYEEAVDALSKQVPDIALVDIMLSGGKTGIDLGALIRDKYDFPFIFVTSHGDKATIQKAVTAQPNGYLMKPFNKENLYAAIEVALDNYFNKEETEEEVVEGRLVKDYLFVKEKHVYKKVAVKEITHIASNGNYLELFVNDRKYLIRSSMKDLLSVLPQDLFFRSHKSYGVNLAYVDSINFNSVRLKDVDVPLSKNYRDEIMMKLQRFS